MNGTLRLHYPPRFWLRFLWLCFVADMWCLVHFGWQRITVKCEDGTHAVGAINGSPLDMNAPTRMFGVIKP